MINSPHEQLAGIALTRVIKFQPRAKVGFLSDAAWPTEAPKVRIVARRRLKFKGGLGLACVGQNRGQKPFLSGLLV